MSDKLPELWVVVEDGLAFFVPKGHPSGHRYLPADSVKADATAAEQAARRAREMLDEAWKLLQVAKPLGFSDREVERWFDRRHVWLRKLEGLETTAAETTDLQGLDPHEQ